MKTTLPRTRVLLFSLLTLAGLGSALGATQPVHFALAKSVPADKTTVHHAPEVKLWFTEPPSDGTVSIRVLDAAGNPVTASEPTLDKQDATASSVAFENALSAGAYTVSWRGMGADGHVVRGDFGFSVAGH